MKKLSFSAPVTISLIIISFIIFVSGLSSLCATHNRIDQNLILHIFGHSSFNHWFGNITLLAILGQSVEDKYGSITTLILVALDAIIIGLAYCFLQPVSCYGLSSVVYMFVVLNTFSSKKDDKISILTILIMIIFICPEIMGLIKNNDNIGHLAHLIAGLNGLIFGIILNTIKTNNA